MLSSTIPRYAKVAIAVLPSKGYININQIHQYLMGLLQNSLLLRKAIFVLRHRHSSREKPQHIQRICLRFSLSTSLSRLKFHFSRYGDSIATDPIVFFKSLCRITKHSTKHSNGDYVKPYFSVTLRVGYDF